MMRLTPSGSVVSSYMSSLPPLPTPDALLGAQRFEGAMTDPALQTRTLQNGVKAHLTQMPNQMQSVLDVMLPLKGLPSGAVGLLLSTLREGSEAMKQWQVDLRNQGIQVMANAQDDKVMLHFEGPAGQEDKLAQAALQLLTRPVVSPDHFRSVQSRYLNTLQGALANPKVMLRAGVNKRLFGPHHEASLTPQEEIARASSQTLGSLMAGYQQMSQSLGQARMLMVSSLPVQEQQNVLNQAIQAAGWYKRVGVPDGPALQPAPLVNSQGTMPPVLLPNETLNRALVNVSFAVPDSRDPDYPAFRLLQEILISTGKGSFFETLRTQHGLVYGIQASPAGKLANGTAFRVGAEVNFEHIGIAINDIRQVGQRASQTPVSPSELASLKRRILLTRRELQQNAPGTGMLHADWMHYDVDPPDLKQYEALVNRVTPGDIQRVANRIFSAPQRLELVGVSAPKQVLDQWFPGYPQGR